MKRITEYENQQQNNNNLYYKIIIIIENKTENEKLNLIYNYNIISNIIIIYLYKNI